MVRLSLAWCHSQWPAFVDLHEGLASDLQVSADDPRREGQYMYCSWSHWLTLVGKSWKTYPGKLKYKYFPQSSFWVVSRGWCSNANHKLSWVTFSVQIFWKLQSLLNRLDIFISPKFSALDEFSRNRPRPFPRIIKLAIGWVFQESNGLMLQKSANKG